MFEDNENLDCPLYKSYINMRYYWIDYGGSSEHDGVIWVGTKSRQIITNT